ncbi:MAG: hypothetical protein ACTHNG_06485 [Ginsengibacter sp.]
MKKQGTFLSLALFLILLFGCQKLKLGAGEFHSVQLNECSDNKASAYICFDSLLTDSRCPAGAECIWQGTALIRVTFHEKNTAHTFKMSLKAFPSLGYPADTTVAGYKISFEKLEPYPSIDGDSSMNEIPKATFLITH